MNGSRVPALALLVGLVTPVAPVGTLGSARASDRVEHRFDGPDAAESFTATATGERVRPDAGPRVHDGGLYLLESWSRLTTSAGFAAPGEERVDRVTVSWTMLMNTGTEGAGFAWLETGGHGTEGAAPEVDRWEAPSIPGSLGVGFDASNPPNRDPFHGSGNVYDRPQHEVSLHFDGMELVKRTTPADFRDEERHAVTLLVQFVTGGAEVTLHIDDDAIYERYFIPSMTAYVGRPAFGARNAETAGDVLIDDLVIDPGDAVPPPQPPLTIVAIDRALNDSAHPRREATVELPEQTDRFGRIICTLRLDKPETRFDPWDRLAAIYVHHDDGGRVEILRYITPYHRGHVWQVDVSDFRPLLRGTRRVEQACTTYGEGWVVSVSFDFHPGPADRVAHEVVTLWSGSPEIGNPERPVESFYEPRSVPIGDETTDARVRMVVTGHGMSPNSRNAAEFMPLGRTLSVNGETFSNELWKADCYLNPCRPQGGTWKYDRAGWAPGDVVRPWEIELGHLVEGGADELAITYALDAYVNEHRGEATPPTHVTEAHVILYRAP